ncbi:hypothetical protein FRACYDRAFT_242337 [Fragilariopsis cylindrus CCMP1102]|uniref:ATPase F1/V1/A1 complex alpha/beta subunit nucleotide-binding domain-containing protein n=1 Tax=Fragilariopsis cylindrus CCMP1102 TaxID=635003 RepID=A0A1E7F795_9STRA|nr:hypothetical protein FRACYDRAFT_242337 [Fragilariopsis cylindrus CCMP1102]|eukprot:OEU13984.1 hypothetical protein FRACYDRAFT_242337 [Fragilariopsis cylindrus CCMP1102]
MFVTVARATANTIITSTKKSPVFLSSTSTAGSLLLFSPQQRRTISQQTNYSTDNVAPLKITKTRKNMNLFHLKHATFMSFLASSSPPSAWSLSPASITMSSSKRSIHYNNHHHHDPLFSRGRQQVTTSGTTSRSKFSTLQSAVTKEDIESPSSSSSSTSTDGGGVAYARGNIVNTFRGGLVAVRIDDDLTDNIMKDAEAELKSTNNDDIIPENVEKEINKNKGVVKPDDALAGDLIGRQVVFENGQMGVVVVHRPPMVYVYRDSKGNDNDNDSVEQPLEGIVTVLDNLFSISVPDNLKTADCFGRNTGLAAMAAATDTKTMMRPILASIPKVNEIALINRPLITGVTMFDALAPIGKGQNMLLIGHNEDRMRGYAMDMISIQKTNDVKCVYAFTGDEDNQKKLKGIMESAGLDEDDVILVSSDDSKDDSSNAAEACLTAAAACAIGEAYAIEEGMDTLVIIDNIDLHKKFWDVTTRSLVDVFGIDAVVKGDRDGGASSEMRAFFSSLVQRSAQFNKKKGGGSVTLLLMQTIPKITDGKDESDIVFSLDDFEGSPEKVKERLKMLVQKNIPLTASTLRKIKIPVPSAEEGKRRLQPGSGARKLSESCVALLAASSGALNNSIDSGVLAGSDEGTQLIRDLLDHVNKSVPGCLDEIDLTLDFTEETKVDIVAAITSYND